MSTIIISSDLKDSISAKLGVSTNDLSILNHFDGSNAVFKLKFNGIPYILKIFNNKVLFNNELYAYILLSDNNCKCPKLINYCDYLYLWILFNYVDGVSLYKSLNSFSRSKLISIFEDIGSVLFNIHSIKIDKKKINCQLWNENKIETLYEQIQSKNYFNQHETIKSAFIIIKSSFSLFDHYKKYSFIHNDLSFKNIIVYKGKVNAIIDFDQSDIGIIYNDFKCLKYNLLNEPLFEQALLRGYGMMEVGFYHKFTRYLLLLESLLYCNSYFLLNLSLFEYYYNIIKKMIKDGV